MRYFEFENIMSQARMSRYLMACKFNTRKAMTLYRLNLRLSQELFTVISCFEIALRNAINNHFLGIIGNDWLRHGASPGGFFDNSKCKITALTIQETVFNLGGSYTHNKLVAELGFGFWRYMIAPNQFNATGRNLLKIFPGKPKSSSFFQYNNTHIFNQLAKINGLRNRIAHHEPICFIRNKPVKNTQYARKHYRLIKELFQWMQIDDSSLLYGLDHINSVCDQIDKL